MSTTFKKTYNRPPPLRKTLSQKIIGGKKLSDSELKRRRSSTVFNFNSKEIKPDKKIIESDLNHADSDVNIIVKKYIKPQVYDNIGIKKYIFKIF